MYIALNIILCLAVLGMVVTINRFFQDKERLKVMLDNTYKRLAAGDEVDEADIRRAGLSGATEKKSYYESLDDLLLYSGLQLRFRRMTPRFVTAVAAFAAFVAFGLTVFVGGKFLYGLAAVVILLAALYTALYLLRIYNYNAEAKEITLFMNMVENFSSTSDDIINILERTSGFLKDPIRSAVTRTVLAAKMDGDITGALKRLSASIEHPLFKRLVYNIELCSRNSCDYRDVIEDFRGRIEQSLAAAKRRDAVYSSCRNEVLLILAVGAFIINLSKSFVDGGGSIFHVLNQNIAGRVIMAFLICTYAVSLWYAVFKLNDRS